MNAVKYLFVFAICAMASLVLSAPALALNGEIQELKIGSFSVDPTSSTTQYIEVERGETLDISVKLHALADMSDVQVNAEIFGFEYNQYEDVRDATRPFEIHADGTKFVKLDVKIPTKTDKDYYRLHIFVGDRSSTLLNQDYMIRINGVDPESAVYVKDFTFNPDPVIAGRAFTAMVNVKNIGDDDLDDIKVTVAVPDLGIKDVEYLDQLDADDSKRFEKLLLRIPECTKPGKYDVTISVDFDEYENTGTESTITVEEDSACDASSQNNNNNNQGNTLIRVPGSQDVAPGATAVYPVMITNAKNVPATYTLAVSGVAFGTIRIDPGSLMVIKSGETKTAYLYLTVNSDTPAGEKVFAVSVDAEGEQKQIPLTAKVTGTQASAGTPGLDDLKKGLEIGIVIFAIVIIIIGVIIAFSKRGKDQKRSGPATETEPYY